ncbi:sigma-70 family RNA polymerase sigma factor [Candidatus Poribacteria bacterium]|nr:sigma-70 family RNA polymerase sigma factor [Candidatus Poribacteria bacterium]MYA57710.1 sigma-70 family RNA polymerase sigma factor [Candidatus Poribacteria bacterium]
MKFHSKNHNGNLDTIAMFIKEHERLLRCIIKTYIKNVDDAEDVFQEATLKILEHFEKGKSVKHPKAWMARIVRNECVNFQRQMERYANRNIALVPFINRAAFGGGMSIPDEQHQAVITQEILDRIAALGSIYSDVVLLWIDGYTAVEISERLGIAEGTVRTRLCYIRKKVREYLQIGNA